MINDRRRVSRRGARRRRVVLVVLAGTLLGAMALSSCAGAPPEPAPAPPPAGAEPLPPDVVRFMDRCRHDVSTWYDDAAITYPRTMDVAVDETRTYVAAIDITGKASPDLLPTGTPTGAELSVQCRVTAELVAPPDGSLTVGESAGSARSLVPTGKAEWSWPVTAVKPGHHDLRLVVQPAVAVGSSVYDDPTEQSVTFVSGVEAQGTIWQRAQYWWDDNWPSIAGVAAAVGAAVLAVVRWSGSLVEAIRRTRSPAGPARGPSTPTSASPPGEPPPEGGSGYM